MKKISVVIPVYNVEKYIERCVRSLFEQTLDNIEYIFVDDASHDNSISIIQSILAEYPHRKESVVFAKHKTNQGLAAARATGLELAIGDYIAHCDSDDWVDRNMYKDLYTKAISIDADIAMCDFIFAYQSHHKRHMCTPFTENKLNSMQAYITNGMTPVWNMIVKRDLYIKNNITPTIGINYCEDFILSVKLLHKACKVVHINKALYYYNQQNTGSLLRSRRKEAEKEEVKAYLEVIDYLKEEGDYPLYAKQLCWRVLRAKQEWILSFEKHKTFLSTYPKSHRYILNNPMINNKLKVMMWCKTHHLGWITNGIIFFRKVLKR